MRIRHWYIFVLVMIAAWAMATVDYKDGVEITTATHMDGFSSAIAYYDGQSVASGVTWDVSTNQLIHYKMNDDAASTTVVDAEANDNGVFTENTEDATTTGRINKALNFDGNDYVSVSAFNDALSNMSISLWYKGSPSSSTHQRICDIYGANKNALMITDSDTVYGSIPANTLAFLDSTTANYIGVTWSNAWDDAWINIIVTGAGTSCKIYVNNVEETSGTITSRATSGTGMVIGSDTSHTYPIIGDLDDVRILDSVLTEAQRTGLYNSGNGTEDDSSAPAGFPSGWGYKVAITITNTLIDADLTDWTMVFDQSFDSVLTSTNGPLDADGTRASLNGGGDIRFSSDSAGNTRLACDIRTWVTSNAPASGTAEAAVLIPSVSSTGQTTIYMWWGKSGETQPGVSETYGQYAAYDDDYCIIYPMSETPSGADSVLDRTSNQCHGTPSNMSSSNQTNGLVGGAYTFNGTDESITSGCALPHQAHTLEFFVYKDGSDFPWFIAQRGGGGNFFQFYGRPNSSDQLMHYWNGSSVVSSTYEITDDGWRNPAITHDGSSTLKFYRGGVFNVSESHSLGASSTENMIIQTDTGNFANGTLDEFRGSKVARSEAWLKANFQNISDGTGFLTWGAISDL